MTMTVRDTDELVTRFVAAGSHVHLAMTASRPNAATLALARAFAGTRSLTVSMTAVHSAAHALALSGAVHKMITGFLGDTYPTPRPNVLYRDLATGTPFDCEMWSVLTMVQRLVAGGTGLPYTTTGSLWGSDLVQGKSLIEVADPRGGDRPVVLAESLRPDITIVHGVCADSRGNVVIVPPVGEGPWSAYAARQGVLATVERIVPDEVIDRHPDRVVIPGERVLAICEVPFGAHPQALHTGGFAGIEGYDEDYEFLSDIAGRGRDLEAMRDWYQEWVSAGGHTGYLDRLGADRLRHLSTRPVTRPVTRPATVAPEQPPTDLERTIVLGARAIQHQVRNGGYDTLLAGVGPSHMASWLAARLLRDKGIDVRVCAETGVYGQQPADGDVYLFSRRHSSQQLSGILDVLGGMVAGNPERCLGVLSAAEVDPFGNINTCLLPDGRWVTGSGGANDIASHVDCVVVAAASPRRYVDAVAHLTSPGRGVREVVSQFGRFRRTHAEEKFGLATWLPGKHRNPDEALAACTRWPAAGTVPADEPDIDDAELAALRALDPEGVYR